MPEILVQLLAVEDFTATSTDLGVTLRRMPGGGPGVVPSSTREHEFVYATVAASLGLLVMGEDKKIVEPATGAGFCAFSDQRVFGVVFDGRTTDGRVKVDPAGAGPIVAFSMDNGVVDEVSEERGRFGKVKAVKLLGGGGALVIGAQAIEKLDGSFASANNGDLLKVAHRFVSQASSSPPAAG